MKRTSCDLHRGVDHNKTISPSRLFTSRSSSTVYFLSDFSPSLCLNLLRYPFISRHFYCLLDAVVVDRLLIAELRQVTILWASKHPDSTAIRTRNSKLSTFPAYCFVLRAYSGNFQTGLTLFLVEIAAR